MNKTMRYFLRFCSIITLSIGAIKLGLSGLLTPGWIAFIIICALLFLAGGKRIIIITAAIAGLLLFARFYGGGNQQATNSIIQSVLCLSIMCFGIYIMFRGFIKTSGRKGYTNKH